MTPDRFPLRALALAAALALGCQSSPETELPAELEPASVRLADIVPLDAGLLEQRVRLDLRVTNPNDVALPVRGLRYELLLGGKPLARGVSPDEFVVPSLSDARISTTAMASSVTLMRQLRALGKRQVSSYSLSGDLFVKGRSEPLPFEHTGEIDFWSDGTNP